MSTIREKLKKAFNLIPKLIYYAVTYIPTLWVTWYFLPYIAISLAVTLAALKSMTFFQHYVALQIPGVRGFLAKMACKFSKITSIIAGSALTLTLSVSAVVFGINNFILTKLEALVTWPFAKQLAKIVAGDSVDKEAKLKKSLSRPWYQLAACLHASPIQAAISKKEAKSAKILLESVSAQVSDAKKNIPSRLLWSVRFRTFEEIYKKAYVPLSELAIDTEDTQLLSAVRALPDCRPRHIHLQELQELLGGVQGLQRLHVSEEGLVDRLFSRTSTDTLTAPQIEFAKLFFQDKNYQDYLKSIAVDKFKEFLSSDNDASIGKMALLLAAVDEIPHAVWLNFFKETETNPGRLLKDLITEWANLIPTPDTEERTKKLDNTIVRSTFLHRLLLSSVIDNELVRSSKIELLKEHLGFIDPRRLLEGRPPEAESDYLFKMPDAAPRYQSLVEGRKRYWGANETLLKASLELDSLSVGMKSREDIESAMVEHNENLAKKIRDVVKSRIPVNLWQHLKLENLQWKQGDNGEWGVVTDVFQQAGEARASAAPTETAQEDSLGEKIDTLMRHTFLRFIKKDLEDEIKQQKPSKDNKKYYQEALTYLNQHLRELSEGDEKHSSALVNLLSPQRTPYFFTENAWYVAWFAKTPLDEPYRGGHFHNLFQKLDLTKLEGVYAEQRRKSLWLSRYIFLYQWSKSDPTAQLTGLHLLVSKMRECMREYSGKNITHRPSCAPGHFTRLADALSGEEGFEFIKGMDERILIKIREKLITYTNEALVSLSEDDQLKLLEALHYFENPNYHLSGEEKFSKEDLLNTYYAFYKKIYQGPLDIWINDILAALRSEILDNLQHEYRAWIQAKIQLCLLEPKLLAYEPYQNITQEIVAKTQKITDPFAEALADEDAMTNIIKGRIKREWLGQRRKYTEAELTQAVVPALAKYKTLLQARSALYQAFIRAISQDSQLSIVTQYQLCQFAQDIFSKLTLDAPVDEAEAALSIKDKVCVVAADNEIGNTDHRVVVLSDFLENHLKETRLRFAKVG